MGGAVSELGQATIEPGELLLTSQLYAYRRKLDYTIFYLEKNELLRGICAFGTET